MAEPGVAVHSVDDAGPCVRVEGAARQQRGGVLGQGPLLHLGHEGFEVGGIGAGERVEVAGGDGVSRQVDDVGEVVAGRELDGVELEHGRDQHDPVEVDVGALQVTGEDRRAGRPVALAEEVAGRVPAFVLAQEAADELRQRARVLVDSPVVGPGRVAEGVAEPGADRVDHDDVGDVEDGVGVVLEGVGGAPCGPTSGVTTRRGPMIPMCSQKEAEPGPPLYAKTRGRSRRGRTVGAEVGGVPELGGGVAVVVREGDARDDGVVVDGLVADGDGMAGLPAGGAGVPAGFLGLDGDGSEQNPGRERAVSRDVHLWVSSRVGGGGGSDAKTGEGGGRPPVSWRATARAVGGLRGGTGHPPTAANEP